MAVESIIYLNYEERWEAYGYQKTTPNHLLVFMDKGACGYRIDGNRYVVEEGDVLFIASGMYRQGEAVNDLPHAKYSIRFSGDSLLLFFPELSGRAVLFKPDGLHAYLRQIYTQMYSIWRKKEPYYKPQCESMLLDVAVRLHREQGTRKQSGKQARLMQQVRDYIMEHYCYPLTIEELSRLAKLSESYLITSFRKYYGTAPIEYMHRLRISKAEEWLLSTDDTMETISQELGYCDSAHFNRMFKKWVGMPPSLYRKLGYV
jgi:AraC-like DNA-binding protein